ncbi:MAG: hypothetical protein DMG38_10835 [Acidobacteria bacterium]|nr:MAG: hypothetical protein DMG38_10835 [Acidobacteriota bacterium]
MGVFASEYEQSCSFVQFSARGGALVRAADYRKFNMAQQDAGEAQKHFWKICRINEQSRLR